MIKKDFKILYLDQFASSNLAFQEEPIWGEIKSLIEKTIKQKKLICPIPHDHFLETPQAEKERVLIIDNYFSKLSGGYMFRTTAYTNSQLIISILRGNNITLNTFIVKDIQQNVLSKKEDIEYYVSRKKDFDKMIEESSTFVNKLRQITHGQKIEKEAKETLFKAYSYASTKEFIERLEELLKNGNIFIRGDKFSFMEVPNWIDQTIYRLVKVHRMTPKETRKLISIIKKSGFSRFPSFDIRFSLYAIMSIEGKKEDAGDHVDIERIASGLPIADYFLIDRQRKSEIIELGFHKKYDTKVFCGNQNDLLELRAELEKI